MDKPIFYEGQQVGCLMFGEGVVELLEDSFVYVKIDDVYRTFYENGAYYKHSRTTLYPIEQYRAIIANIPAPEPEKWQPKPGEWCLFWDDEFKFIIVLAKFKRMVNNKFKTELNETWQHCAPFTGELPEHLKEVQP